MSGETELSITSCTLSEEDALRLQNNFLELDTALEQDLPVYRNLMATIHDVLRKDPTVFTILKPEEAALLVKGASKALNTYIVAKEAKPKGRKITAADL